MSPSLNCTSATWPTQCADLKAILNLQDPNDFRCHGYAKSTLDTCKTHITKVQASKVPKILQKIVSAGKFDHVVSQCLQDLASIVMCRRWHQGQAPAKLYLWRECLITRGDSLVVKNEDTTSMPSRNSRSSPSSACQTNSSSISQAAPQLTTERTSIQPLSRSKTDQSNDSRSYKSSLPPECKSRYASQPVHFDGGYSNSYHSPPSANTRSRTTQRTPAAHRRTPSQEARLAVHTFDKYGAQLNTYGVNSLIAEKLKHLLYGEELDVNGFVYGYTYPSHHRVTNDVSMPYIKIGYSRDVANRMSSWEKKCHYTPQVQFSLCTPYFKRIEKIIHTFLHNLRRRERGCPGCGVKHLEWFAVDADYAKSVVSMWRAWARTRPYDESGRLLDVWQRRLAKLDLNDPECWADFINSALPVRSTKAEASSANPLESRTPKIVPITPGSLPSRCTNAPASQPAAT